MSSEDAGGYVHDPAEFREDADGEDDEEPSAAQAPASDEDREFGWRGWVLVGAIAVCFLVIPAMILYVPYTEGLTFVGLPYIHTLVALPLIPAVVLALLAVWATARE